jgi:hypothetical protein
MLVNLHIYVAEFDKYVYYVLPGVYRYPVYMNCKINVISSLSVLPLSGPPWQTSSANTLHRPACCPVA